jgi:hypothetical protein
MTRWLGKIFGLLALVVAGAAGIVLYQNNTIPSRQIARLQQDNQKLEQARVKLESDKKELENVVSRLEGEKRIADVLVARQENVEGAGIQTTLLFVEYDRNGQPMPAKSFVIAGTTAHLDAMVIKFDHDFVSKSDPLRGHSIALFTRIYGDSQAPSSAQLIDQPGTIPDVYRGADPKVSAFELALWKDFWKLYEDDAYRKAKGVRALGGHGVWGPFELGKLYTVTIESDGGLNMTSEPLKGIYKELIRQRNAAATQPIALLHR